MIPTADNYFSLESDREYMSVHQYQNWRACAKAEFERQAGRYVPETPDVFLQGHYVEVGLQGTPDDVAAFKAAHPEMFKKNGEILAKYELCQKMVARAKRDFGFMELMRGDAQVIVTGEIQGVQWKGKPDVLKLDWRIPCFVDLKTTAGFGSVWESYYDPEQQATRNEKIPWYDRYWFQFAVYRELIRQWTGRTLEPVIALPVIAGISKEDPPGLRALTFDSTDRLEAELSIGLANLSQIMAYKRGDAEPPACGDCDWCREHLEMRIMQAENYRKRGR